MRKEELLKKYAATVGINPKHVTHCREYSVEQLEISIAFFELLHKGDVERVKEFLALIAKESIDTGSAEGVEVQRSHATEQ